MINNSTDENPPEDTGLKGLLYGLMDLEDRLRDERLVVKTQSAKLDELIQSFTAQVQTFKQSVPTIQRQMRDTMAAGMKESAHSVGETLAKVAAEQVEKSTQQLQASVRLATHELNSFERKKEKSFYYAMAALIGLVLLTGFFVGKFAVPAPYLPLSGDQLETYKKGAALERIWPKLSDEEKKRLETLSHGDEPERAANR